MVAVDALSPSQIVWPSKAYTTAFLNTILPQASAFVEKTGIALKIPLTTNDVDMSKYTCVIDRGIPNAQFYLKNGDRFNFSHGHIDAFYAHDAFSKFPEIGNVEDYLGKRTVSTNDAIALTKQIVRKLGYTEKKMDMNFRTPVYVGNNKFTRYFICCRRPNEDDEFAVFEIDLQDKSIKSVYFDDPSAWREPPKNEVDPLGKP